jgi:hypothetical protein
MLFFDPGKAGTRATFITEERILGFYLALQPHDGGEVNFLDASN